MGAGALLFLAAAPAHPHRLVSSRCNESGQRYVEALAAEKRARAVVDFRPELRNQWSYRPGSAFRQQGLRTGEMTEAERVRAHQLIGCALSSQGYLRTAGIIRLDNLVRELAPQIVMNTNRDGSGVVELGDGYFWLTVFGTPGPDAPWGLQLEGHHLVLNMTYTADGVAVTPAFWGAWPARVQAGELAGFAPLANSEIAAFELLESLTSAQRRLAIVSPTKPQGIFTSPERNKVLTAYEGISANALNTAQRAQLLRLVGEYIGNFDPELAAEWLERVRSDGWRSLHFAWMGAPARGQAIYYRIHGPSILVEFDHAPNITRPGLPADPNHIHTIVRWPADDMGEDLLARHYRDDPDHARR